MSSMLTVPSSNRFNDFSLQAIQRRKTADQKLLMRQRFFAASVRTVDYRKTMRQWCRQQQQQQHVVLRSLFELQGTQHVRACGPTRRTYELLRRQRRRALTASTGEPTDDCCPPLNNKSATEADANSFKQSLLLLLLLLLPAVTTTVCIRCVQRGAIASRTRRSSGRR
jgi:hypothetical protein